MAFGGARRGLRAGPAERDGTGCGRADRSRVTRPEVALLVPRNDAIAADRRAGEATGGRAGPPGDDGTRRCAASRTIHRSCVTLLTWVDNAVPTKVDSRANAPRVGPSTCAGEPAFDHAGRTAPAACYAVLAAKVALFAGVENPVAANPYLHARMSRLRANIAGLDGTHSRAPIARHRVSIVALLARVEHAVAANAGIALGIGIPAVGVPADRETNPTLPRTT